MVTLAKAGFIGLSIFSFHFSCTQHACRSNSLSLMTAPAASFYTHTEQTCGRAVGKASRHEKADPCRSLRAPGLSERATAAQATDVCERGKNGIQAFLANRHYYF